MARESGYHTTNATKFLLHHPAIELRPQLQSRDKQNKSGYTLQYLRIGCLQLARTWNDCFEHFARMPLLEGIRTGMADLMGIRGFKLWAFNIRSLYQAITECPLDALVRSGLPVRFHAISIVFRISRKFHFISLMFFDYFHFIFQLRFL